MHRPLPSRVRDGGPVPTGRVRRRPALLFSGAPEFSWREIVSNWRDPCYAAAVLLFAILPAFSFLNLWDSYLSSALYSGNLTEAQIYLSDAGKASLPAPIRSRPTAA